LKYPSPRIFLEADFSVRMSRFIRVIVVSLLTSLAAICGPRDTFAATTSSKVALVIGQRQIP
jgi:hypothetical protein